MVVLWGGVVSYEQGTPVEGLCELREKDVTSAAVLAVQYPAVNDQPPATSLTQSLGMRV